MVEQHRLDDARQHLRQAVALSRRFAEAWNWLGIVHLNLGEHAQARHCLVRCVAINRNSANGWYNLGTVYQVLGNEAESAKCMARSQALAGTAQPEEGISKAKLFHTRERPPHRP